MSFFEILLLGVGLAMDAVAVSMTNGMVYKNLNKGQYLAMPLFFGIFQAAMPVGGYFAGELFAKIIDKYSGIVILVILGIIGGKMIIEGIKHLKHPEIPREKELTVGILFFQAIATSIDAFAVGIGFNAMQVDIGLAVSVIGIVTAVLVVAAILIGRKFGDLLGSRAEILGGLILVVIGIKALFS